LLPEISYFIVSMDHTIQAEYKNTVQQLGAAYPPEEARAIADRLFEHFFELLPASRILSGNAMPQPGSVLLLQEAIIKLLNHVPLQYVTGVAYFMDMEFSVNPSVLIPRPETEELVSLILSHIGTADPLQDPTIIDIGTGSGCIAIALKQNIRGAKVTAVDFSEDALSVASINAAANHTEIEFIHADILDQDSWDALPGCDVIVSNPPYVTHAEKPLMLANVLNYEPHTALFVPDNDPLLFYRAILRLAKIKLSSKGMLWFEINEMFGDELRNLAMDQGFNKVNIIFDFRGKSRFLQCYNY